MGGRAFSGSTNSPLLTPRMPPDIYFRLRDHYLQLLSSLYTQIATPIEAPEKTSYGDIDILVSQPKSIPTSASAEDLATVLGAERTFVNSGSPLTSFAVPYPDLPNNYVQLDLHICPPETFHWQRFHQSHGDLVRNFRSYHSIFGTNLEPQDRILEKPPAPDIKIYFIKPDPTQ